MNTPIRELPPSQKAEAKAEIETKLAKLSTLRGQLLREDFTKTFQTEHGKRVLAWLFERCGYNKPKLAATAQGVIDETLTTHNAMEENLYIAIRKYIAVDVLIQVEYETIKPSGTILESHAANSKTKKPTKKKKG